jgi:hypothetical protein
VDGLNVRGRTRLSRFGRGVALVLLGLPLLATGPCLTTAEESVINGFFDAVTPLLIERTAEDLGVTAPTEYLPVSGGTTGSQTTT